MIAVREVALTTTTLVAAAPPTVTLLAPNKFVPVIVKVVPPAVGPKVGSRLVIVGGEGSTYVNAAVLVATPRSVVTSTSLVPRVPAGVIKAIFVLSDTVKLAALTPPTFTLLVFVKFVPTIDI